MRATEGQERRASDVTNERRRRPYTQSVRRDLHNLPKDKMIDKLTNMRSLLFTPKYMDMDAQPVKDDGCASTLSMRFGVKSRLRILTLVNSSLIF